MFKFVILSIVVVGTYGMSYGSSGSAYGYGSNSRGSGRSYGGAISAAIKSERTSEIVPVRDEGEPAIPQEIIVEAAEQPVRVTFKSISSPVHVKQIHTPGAPGQIDRSNSEDEPHRVVHEVLRPVIQEVHEVIQPYRRVVQEVRPVLEEIHTKVAQKESRYSEYSEPNIQSYADEYGREEVIHLGGSGGSGGNGYKLKSA